MTVTRLLLAAATLAIAAPMLAGCQLGDTAAPQTTLPGTAGPGAGEPSISSAEPRRPTSSAAPASAPSKQPASFVPPTRFTHESLNYSASPNPGGTSIIFPVPEGWRREEFKTDKDRHGEDNVEIAFTDPTGQVMLRLEKASPAQCCDPKTVLRDKAALLFESAPGYQQVFLEDIACCNTSPTYSAASVGIEYDAEGLRKRGEYRAVDMGDGVAIVALVAPVDLWADALPVLDRAWTVEFAG